MNRFVLIISFFLASLHVNAQISLSRFEGLKLGMGVYPQTGEISLKTPPRESAQFIKRLGLEVRGKANYWVFSPTETLLTYSIDARLVHRLMVRKKATFYQAPSFIYEKKGHEVIYGAGFPVGFEVFPFTEIRGLALVFEANFTYKTTGDNAKNYGLTSIFGFNYFFHKD